MVQCLFDDLDVHTYDGKFPHVSLLLPKETLLRHVVLRWCNLAKERLCFRPRCCHSTEGRALYCTWLNSSTGIVNTAQCGASFLSRLPPNLEIAFTNWFTLVLPEKDNLSQKLIARFFSYPELGIESRPVVVIAEQSTKDDSWTRGTK